jgi:hypothetical protein
MITRRELSPRDDPSKDAMCGGSQRLTSIDATRRFKERANRSIKGNGLGVGQAGRTRSGSERRPQISPFSEERGASENSLRRCNPKTRRAQTKKPPVP